MNVAKEDAANATSGWAIAAAKLMDPIHC